jgi:hypothetical protein
MHTCKHPPKGAYSPHTLHIYAPGRVVRRRNSPIVDSTHTDDEADSATAFSPEDSNVLDRTEHPRLRHCGPISGAVRLHAISDVTFRGALYDLYAYVDFLVAVRCRNLEDDLLPDLAGQGLNR